MNPKYSGTIVLYTNTRNELIKKHEPTCNHIYWNYVYISSKRVQFWSRGDYWNPRKHIHRVCYYTAGSLVEFNVITFFILIIGFYAARSFYFFLTWQRCCMNYNKEICSFTCRFMYVCVCLRICKCIFYLIKLPRKRNPFPFYLHVTMLRAPYAPVRLESIRSVDDLFLSRLLESKAHARWCASVAHRGRRTRRRAFYNVILSHIFDRRNFTNICHIVFLKQHSYCIAINSFAAEISQSNLNITLLFNFNCNVSHHIYFKHKGNKSSYCNLDWV